MRSRRPNPAISRVRKRATSRPTNATSARFRRRRRRAKVRAMRRNPKRVVMMRGRRTSHSVS
jgi:hypothetical protein